MKKFAIVLLAVALMATGAIAKDKPQPVISALGALDCSGAIPIGCNESVAGSNVGLPNNVEAYSCVGWTESGGDAVYELVLDGEYVVTGAISDLGADLDIFFLDGCEEAACLAFGNTQFTMTAGPGTYYIVVDGYNGAESTFTLTVDCDAVQAPPPPLAGGETCDDAVDIQTASLSYFSVDLTTYTDDYDSDCFSWSLAGGDAVFKIDLNSGESFTATMDGSCDMAMYIMGDCASGISLDCSDNCCSGAQEFVDFIAPYTGTFYLILDAYTSGGCEVIVNIDAPVATDRANWGNVKSLFR